MSNVAKALATIGDDELIEMTGAATGDAQRGGSLEYKIAALVAQHGGKGARNFVYALARTPRVRTGAGAFDFKRYDSKVRFPEPMIIARNRAFDLYLIRCTCHAADDAARFEAMLGANGKDGEAEMWTGARVPASVRGNVDNV